MNIFPISQEKIDTIILGACGQGVYITQNNKVAISLQYIQKEVSDEDFLHVDKHESSLQINTVIFDVHDPIFPKFLKYQVCNVFTISPKTS